MWSKIFRYFTLKSNSFRSKFERTYLAYCFVKSYKLSRLEDRLSRSMNYLMRFFLPNILTILVIGIKDFYRGWKLGKVSSFLSLLVSFLALIRLEVFLKNNSYFSDPSFTDSRKCLGDMGISLSSGYTDLWRIGLKFNFGESSLILGSKVRMSVSTLLSYRWTITNEWILFIVINVIIKKNSVFDSIFVMLQRGYKIWEMIKITECN